jgi:deoxyribonucleoside regulator
VRQRQVPAAGIETRTNDLLTEIATRHYLQGESQVTIARTLGLDPSTVSRSLKRAREEGIVHIEIRAPRREELDLGRGLATRYGLGRVVVAPNSPDLEDALSPIAAEFVQGLLRGGLRLGISWGNTLAGLVRHLRPGTVAELTIAQLAGGVDDPTPGIQGHELARSLVELYPDSRVHYLHAPAIVASEAAREVFLADRTVRVALEAARRCELALVGIGQVDERSTLFRGGHVSGTDWARLRDVGAVGNMNTRFFDRLGRPVGELDRRTIAITWKELRAIPTVVAIAAGLDKTRAIAGALRTGAVDMLVTDEPTARAILETEV